jgi:hypothetical protein
MGNGSDLAADEAPPPGSLALQGPTHLVGGIANTFTATGTLGDGEPVYLVASTGGPGAGPCLAALGGACLPTVTPVILASAVASGGAATFSITPPGAVPAGLQVTLAAVVIRGRNGVNTLVSAGWADVIEGQNPGCTDDIADNYDPSYNIDDGSCVYSVIPCDGTFASISTQADVAAYENCSTLAGIYLYHTTEVTSVELPNLEAVHGYVYFDHTVGLTTVDLSGLSTVDQYVYFDANADLTSLTFGSMTSVGWYSYFTNNSQACVDAQADWAGISAQYAYLTGNGPCP